MTLAAANARRALDGCLDFWITHGWDRADGGMFTHLDRHGAVYDTDKSIWAQGRVAWMLLRCNDALGEDDTRSAMAASAWDFLRAHGTGDDGGMLFSVTGDGRPLRQRRYVFSECFTAMAAAARGEADHANALLGRVWDVFEGRTPVEPKTNTDTRPMIGLGLPMILVNLLQEFRRTIGGDDINARIDACIDAIGPLVRDDEGAVLEVAAPDGSIIDHAQGRQLNPGHAIEAASFVLAEAMHRQCNELQALGLRMLTYAFDRGWDDTFGGMTSFVDLHGKPCVEYWHEMKFWWPQFEALVALLRAHACTGDQQWWDKADMVHDWIGDHVKDPDGPECFGYLRRDGTPSSTHKGDLWKGAFHVPRALLDVYELLSRA